VGAQILDVMTVGEQEIGDNSFGRQACVVSGDGNPHDQPTTLGRTLAVARSWARASHFWLLTCGFHL
jgi:hypothetical protein